MSMSLSYDDASLEAAFKEAEWDMASEFGVENRQKAVKKEKSKGSKSGKVRFNLSVVLDIFCFPHYECT